MRLPRSVIGQYVELVWRDPGMLGRILLEKAPKGLDGLATWTERGVIDDITDGIVRLIHSIGIDAPGDPHPDGAEGIPVYVHEALIEDDFLFEGRRSLKEAVSYKAEKEGGGT